MEINSLLKAIKFGLENHSTFVEDTKNFRIKEVRVQNVNAVECQFYTDYIYSNDIKMDISQITAFLSGFFKEDPWECIKPTMFLVRAYNDQEVEQVNATCSKETAALIGQGKSVDWLKNTIFQENTPDHRMLLAKRQISEIENSLRHTIVQVLSARHGANWWTESVGGNLRNSVEGMYSRQYGGATTDGSVLINMTFMPDLKKIICTCWPDFSRFFSSRIDFEDKMDELNAIRRIEAHNREISEANLAELDTIYNFLLHVIGSEYPDLVPVYLIENWRSRIKQIMNRPVKLYTDSEISAELGLTLEQSKFLAPIINDLMVIKDKEADLKSIPVPIQKRTLHDRIVTSYEEFKVICETIIAHLQRGQVKEAQEALKKREEYAIKLDTFANEFLLSEA